MELETLEEQTFIDDPLLCKVDLPLRAVFYPLGFAFEITTNSQAVLDAAGQSWGHTKQRDSGPILRLRIGVTKGTSRELSAGPGSPLPTEFALDGRGCPQPGDLRSQRRLCLRLAHGRRSSSSQLYPIPLHRGSCSHPYLHLLCHSHTCRVRQPVREGPIAVRRFRSRQIDSGLRLRSQRMAFYVR